MVGNSIRFRALRNPSSLFELQVAHCLLSDSNVGRFLGAHHVDVVVVIVRGLGEARRLLALLILSSGSSSMPWSSGSR